jgi:hypothetical protein
MKSQKYFVYKIWDGKIMFFKGTNKIKKYWSPNPKDAYDFPYQWIDTPNGERYRNLATIFAEENGAHLCIGDPNDLLDLHNRGPQIGQQVRINRIRYDGFVYGTGVVVRYTQFLPTSLTHTVELDNPPEAGAPDEWGEILTRDPEILRYYHCHATELIVM